MHMLAIFHPICYSFYLVRDDWLGATASYSLNDQYIIRSKDMKLLTSRRLRHGSHFRLDHEIVSIQLIVGHIRQLFVRHDNLARTARFALLLWWCGRAIKIHAFGRFVLGFFGLFSLELVLLD